MKLVYKLILLCIGISNFAYSQTTYTGIFRSASPYSNYHQFTRNGGGAAVYINQLDVSKPILRLSSNSGSANANVLFTVEGSGIVGIGTTSPTNGLLHIYKNATTGIWGSITTANAGLRIQDQGASMYLDGNSIFTSSQMNLGTYTSHAITFGTNETERARITSDGNFGIGESSPSSILHVKSSNSWNPTESGILVENSNDVNSEGNANVFAKVRENGGDAYFTVDVHNTSAWSFGLDNSDEDKFKIANHWKDLDVDTKLTIKSDGNVGIGTTTPDAKLTVKGNIHAERVTVDLNIPAPDYVFEEDYDLRSLEETATYIAKNKHLPEVPSARELEASGIDLVEMNMLLLKKIEELTLHMIKQNKKIEYQNIRIEELESNLNTLKK